MSQVKPIPDGMHSLTPHLCCDGAAQAIEFYKKAFNAQELARMAGPNGKLMHAMLKIGDSHFMLNDEFPEFGGFGPLKLKGSPVVIHMYVTDVDASMAQALAAGGKLTMPVADMFWGDRYGQLEDPFGNTWAVSTHMKDLSREEMTKAGAAAAKMMK